MVRKIIKYSVLLILVIIAVFVVYYSPSYVYRVFVWQDANYDDFERLSLSSIYKAEKPFYFIPGSKEQQEIAKATFEQHALVKNIDSFLINEQTYAFIVIKNDTILFEKYYNNNNRESLQSSFSTAKSIISLLIGKALEENKIKGINDPITKYIPELLERDLRFEKITINDLLRMRSGIAYRHGIRFPIVNCDDPLAYYHPDLRRIAIEKTTIEVEPDKKFLYNNYNTLLLGLILERTTGKSVSNYFEEELWQKIGAEFDASWNSDENGFEQMQSGINAKAIDFAKIGRLVLNNGNWNGIQILNKEWIENSTRPYDTLVFSSGQKWGYSYMWWSVIKENSEPDTFGCGRFGQFIYISPSSNSIIIRHGLKPSEIDDDDWTDIFSFYTSNL